jgi:murein L,D-transpeptidase YcbB/YkuD
LRDISTGRHKRPVLFKFSKTIAAAVTLLAAAPLALVPVAPANAAVRADTGRGLSIEDFYRARDNRPLWFVAGHAGAQVGDLLSILDTASVDGLDPTKYDVGQLRALVAKAARGNSRAVHKADLALSEALVAYVRDIRHPGDLGIDYVDPELRPGPPAPRAILEAAARAPSADGYVKSMGWMHPIYAELREALLSGDYGTDADRIRVNLERARELPPADQKHILVNAAQQRLYMYDHGKVVDSMRVVVGKPIYPTPMMAAFIRYAALNPYWYVPPDLATERIAPNVVRLGQKYLDRQGYKVVSDFVGDPTVIDPATVDWKAVAAGKLNVLIRQDPGPWNSMGRIKFMFPNSSGVYLHDNPERELFEEASRLYSGGCVRLESAWRLSHWLFGRDLSWQGAGVQEKVPLPTPVPVYITYLTAVPDGTKIAFFDDVYGRDATRLAALGKAVTSRSGAATQAVALGR